MKANSPASCWLSIRYHGPKNVRGRSSVTLILRSNYGRASVQQKSPPGGFREKTSRRKKARVYGVGEASAGDSVVPPVDVDVPVEDSVVEAGLVASVVVGGLVAAGVAAGSVVSVFCSHAARSAALARMQMYFFIVLIGRGILL
jgi:hypothetical protein